MTRRTTPKNTNENITKAKKDLKKRTNDAKHIKKNKNSLFMIHDDNFWMAQRNCAVYLVAEDLETYIIQTLHEPKKQKTHISKTHIFVHL